MVNLLSSSYVLKESLPAVESLVEVSLSLKYTQFLPFPPKVVKKWQNYLSIFCKMCYVLSNFWSRILS